MLQRLNSDFHPKSPKGGGNFLFRAVIKILLVDLSRRENKQWLVAGTDNMQILTRD